MSTTRTARIEISKDMLLDMAGQLNYGATWADLSRQYGISAATLKRAYLRKSAEVYPRAAA